ncbi:PREDICTED: uncharacterized protein LOC109208256 [Nicotiana attenuata]|uniref:uncharacterized protein LOC109208256 n=1 Tax=Nicotiana attenuata TaxID=49451 RepID=UPI000904E855|nr:PREDICTED: uncharacterized protein LOC109208256 [Nicotiana attenuata]
MSDYEEEVDENPIADIDEYIEDTNAIVPPVVGASTFKVEHGLILMLKAEGFFRNSTDDDPTQHLRNFLGVCVMHKQNNVSDDALRLRVFKYSLDGDARRWLQNLPPNSIRSWPELDRAFLAKWFPQSNKSELQDKIFFFKQHPGEHLHEAWDRFKLYLVRSPNHGFPDSILLDKFYMGLDPMNQSIAKNAADGYFMDKSFARVTQILDKMAKHNQAWHSEDTTSGVAYGSPSSTNLIKENQERDQVIAGLATNVNVLTKMFTESQTKKVNVVEDVQPISNEDFEEANYIKNSQGGYQRQQYQGQGQQNQWRPNPQGQGNKIRSKKGTLPSDTIANPKGSGSGPTSHIMAITTRSGKVLQGEGEQVIEVDESEQGVEVEEPSVVEVEKIPEDLQVQKENREEVKEKVEEIPKTLPPIPRPPPPFPQRPVRKFDDSKLEKFYDILKQLSVNIPFVETFQEMRGLLNI